LSAQHKRWLKTGYAMFCYRSWNVTTVNKLLKKLCDFGSVAMNGERTTSDC